MSARELLLTPRGFLITGGIVLVILGIVGFLIVFTSPAFYLTTGENVAHLAIGLVALAAVLVPGLKTAARPYYRWLTLAIGLVALFFAVYGLLLPGSSNPPVDLNCFGVANLEFWDSVLNFIVFGWAFGAAFATQEGTVAKA
jgi:hypothetical protein